MKVAGSIALVTGANRGLGLAFAKALVERGAAKVYAAARNTKAVTLKGVMPLKLDVTSQEDVVAAARVAGDVNLLINNAGIARPGGFLAGPRLCEKSHGCYDSFLNRQAGATDVRLCGRD